jgi:hypothetical protein
MFATPKGLILTVDALPVFLHDEEMMMRQRKEKITRGTHLLLALLLAGFGALSCGPGECREVPSFAEIEERIADGLEDHFDEIDARIDQRGAIDKLNGGLRPERRRLRRERQRDKTAILDELQAARPDGKKIEAVIQESAARQMAYLDKLLVAANDGHRALTAQQRSVLAEKWSAWEPELPTFWWAARGLDYMAFRIDATVGQRALVAETFQRFQRRLRVVLGSQKRVRTRLIELWLADRWDVDRARPIVAKAGLEMTGFIVATLDDIVTATAVFSAEQRAFTNAALDRARTCPPG